MPGGLEDGCQEFWSHPVASIMGVRWPGYVSPSGDNQRVIWDSGVCPDVYPGVDTGLESSKSLSSQAT